MAALNRVPLPVLSTAAAISYAFNLGMRTTRFEELGNAVIQAVLASAVLNATNTASIPTPYEDATFMTLCQPSNLATWARNCNIALSNSSDNIAARAFSCYIGATYDQHGGQVVEELIAALINPVTPRAKELLSRKRKAIEFNEFAQKRRPILKVSYEMSGPHQGNTWNCKVLVNGRTAGTGTASTKKVAKWIACAAAWDNLEL